MAEQNGKPFDPSDCLHRSVADVICGITFGEGYDTTNQDLNKLLKLKVKLLGKVEDIMVVTEADFFPLAQYLPIKGRDRLIQAFFEMFSIIRKFLRERTGHFDPEKPGQDFISGLLHARHEAECNNDEERNALLSDDYFVNNIEDMFAAGYESITSAMKWATAFLVI